MMNPQFAGMGMGMNFGMQNPNMNFNMNMPNNFMNMNMNMMDMGQDEEWLKGFKMGVEEVNNTGDQDSDANSPGPKINVIFKTTQGTTHTMVYNYGTTIDKSLAKYLNRVGRPDLIGDKSNKIYNDESAVWYGYGHGIWNAKYDANASNDEYGCR